MNSTDKPTPSRNAIPPPPPSQDKVHIRTLALDIIGKLETQLKEGDITLAQIANELGEINDLHDLNYISPVSNEILLAITAFCSTKELRECIPTALHDVKLHFCANASNFEKSPPTEKQKEKELRMELEHFIKSAVEKGFFTPEEIKKAFNKVHCAEDLECGHGESIIIEAINSICKSVAGKHGVGIYTYNAIISIKAALATETLL